MNPVKTLTVVPKAPFLSNELVQAAHNHDSAMPHYDPSSRVGGHIDFLAKWGVVGFSIRHQMKCVREFLHFHRVVHSTNERGVLWLPEFNAKIKTLLGS